MKIKKLTALLSAAAVSLSMLGTSAFAEGEDPTAVIKQMVDSMDTREKVEQMIMITLRPWNAEGENESVTSLNDDLTYFIESHNFGGVCLYADNVQTTAQTVELTNQIQQAAKNSYCGIPMLISADQEGGRIYRLGTGTPTCGNMALGATNDPELAYENAKILASEIKALGINTDLAPVIDVNNNPSNPVIGLRSFSSDSEIVGAMGEKYVEGLQSEGIITTCKHFPGHGDTSVDSHTGLPLINKTYDELKKVELAPYSSVIDKTDMIMTAHIQFPKIETGEYVSKSTGEKINIPATLSKTIITDILRKDLGYDGVVITDSMVMSAIKENFGLVDSATLAINADVDMILEPLYVQNVSDFYEIDQYVAMIEAQIENGVIPMETIDKSVTRILTMKQERGLLDYKPADVDNALKIVGSAENREKALQIAEKAVTLVKNDGDLLPLDLGENGKAAYFYPYDNVENTMAFALDRLKKDGVVSDGVTADCICYQNHTADEYEETVKNCDVVILAVEMYSLANLDKTSNRGWQAVFADDIIELAHKNGKKVVFLSANMPYDVARFTEADAILASYCATGMDELPVDGQENVAYGVNYPAALITIFGGNDPVGKLPIDVYSIDENTQYTDEILYELGYGLSYKQIAPEPDDESSLPDESSEAESSAPDDIIQESSAAANESGKTDSSSKAASTASTSNPSTGAGVSVAVITLLAGAAVTLKKKRD